MDFYKLRFAFVFSTRCSLVVNVLVLVMKKCGLIKTIAALVHMITDVPLPVPEYPDLLREKLKYAL